VKLVFGDVVLNGYASDTNPIRFGIVVRVGKRTGRLNPGPYVELTDGKGKFWQISLSCDRLKKIGSIHEAAVRLRDSAGEIIELQRENTEMKQ
jgi:hypothetical protein